MDYSPASNIIGDNTYHFSQTQRKYIDNPDGRCDQRIMLF